MKHERRHSGVCTSRSEVELNENGEIEEIKVFGGCDGNLKGVVELLRGMKAEDAIPRIENIVCGHKKTSCPAEIALTLREALDIKE